MVTQINIIVVGIYRHLLYGFPLNTKVITEISLLYMGIGVSQYSD